MVIKNMTNMEDLFNHLKKYNNEFHIKFIF